MGACLKLHWCILILACKRYAMLQVAKTNIRCGYVCIALKPMNFTLEKKEKCAIEIKKKSLYRDHRCSKCEGSVDNAVSTAVCKGSARRREGF
jgi:hypothetical protein